MIIVDQVTARSTQGTGPFWPCSFLAAPPATLSASAIRAEYLADPKGTLPGTTTVFAGVKKDDERADVVAYLQTLK